MKVNSAAGMRKTTAPAAIGPQAVPPDPVKLIIEGGAVRGCALERICEKANSFHAVIKQNTAVAAIPVIACGKDIFKNVWILE